MGMGRPDLAAQRAWLGLRMTTAYMGICALVFVLFRRQLIGVFVPHDLVEAEAEALLQVGGAVMIAAAVFQVFDAVAITTSAALRGAGDTVWPGIITVVSSWVCIVGVGHAALYWLPELGSIGPWIGASAFIIMLGTLLMTRFVRGRWKSIDVLGSSAAALDPKYPAPTEAVAGGMPGEA